MNKLQRNKKMSYPSLQDLKKTFEYLCRKSYKGVRGVLIFEGKQQGSTALISIMTHGNEVNSLAAAWYLLKEKETIKKQLKGKIILTLNNIEAGKKYFLARTAQEKLSAREKDIDMNRLPKGALSQKSPSRPYEIKRIQKLYPIWKQAKIGLDFHGSELPTKAIIINIKGDHRRLNNLCKSIPIRTRLRNMTSIQIGIPVGSLFGGMKKNIPVIEIESGLNEARQGIINVIKITHSFLLNLGFLGTAPSKKKSYFQEIHKVIGSVILPNISYRLTEKFSMFEPIHKGEIIAAGEGKPIIAKTECCAIFSSSTLACTDPKRVVEEELFLTEKKNTKK